MLYEELKARTNNEATLEEYDYVNRIYMDSNVMTKEDAAALWYGLYEKKHRQEKRERNKVNNQCHNLKWLVEYVTGKTGEIRLPNGDIVRPSYKWGQLTSIEHLNINKGRWVEIAYLSYDGTMKKLPRSGYTLN